MGGGGQTSKTVEGQLSKEQAKLIKIRQKDYEDHFRPILIRGLEESDDGSAARMNMAQQTSGINQNYNQAKMAFSQAMAQRGLGGSGVEAQGLAGLQNTRAQNLANAYYTAQQQGKNEKMNYLQLALSMTPSTTTAAPTLSKTGNETIWNSFW
jgi:hypothetical protein